LKLGAKIHDDGAYALHFETAAGSLADRTYGVRLLREKP
jgi:hypothetical protein